MRIGRLVLGLGQKEELEEERKEGMRRTAEGEGKKEEAGQAEQRGGEERGRGSFQFQPLLCHVVVVVVVVVVVDDGWFCIICLMKGHTNTNTVEKNLAINNERNLIIGQSRSFARAEVHSSLFGVQPLGID